MREAECDWKCGWKGNPVSDNKGPCKTQQGRFHLRSQSHEPCESGSTGQRQSQNREEGELDIREILHVWL